MLNDRSRTTEKAQADERGHSHIDELDGHTRNPDDDFNSQMPIPTDSELYAGQDQVDGIGFLARQADLYGRGSAGSDRSAGKNHI